MKVLVIDDNDQDLKIIERILKRAGYEDLILAQNGEEAVDIAKAENPELVISDTILPGIDGFEVCRRIKADCKAKIIIMTGHIDAVDAGKAREAGADDYLVKSSDYDPLLKAIKGLI